MPTTKPQEAQRNFMPSLGPVPALPVVLAVAKMGVKNPNGLTEREIRDISRTLLVHFAQMGIH